MQGRLWKTLWKMENLTGTKVYVSSKHLVIPHVRGKIFLLNSITCLHALTGAEIRYRSAPSVHNCAISGGELRRSAAKLDATLEEMS